MIVLVGVCVGGGGERERERRGEGKGEGEGRERGRKGRRGRRGEGEGGEERERGEGRGRGEKWCGCEVWGERMKGLFAVTCSNMRDIARDAYNLQSPNYVVYSSVLLVKDV